VTRARVDVAGTTIASIELGLLVLLCVEHGDENEAAEYLARKTARLRIFEDEAGKMNRSVGDVSGAVLAVSQFTLAADTRRGNRPSFTRAAEPIRAEELYTAFCVALSAEGVPVERGRFAAHMTVSLDNEGPVTIWLDSHDR
jgi:D-tyrosyl-tRNA(Tyr) deacylase